MLRNNTYAAHPVLEKSKTAVDLKGTGEDEGGDRETKRDSSENDDLNQASDNDEDQCSDEKGLHLGAACVRFSARRFVG